MAKQFTIDATDFIEMLCRRAGDDGQYREGTSRGADPTFWSTRTVFICKEAHREKERVYLLEINQSWGTEIKLTWLAPRDGHKQNRVKINAYYDPQWSHSESRPFTQEHFNILMEMMTDRDTEWMRSRPLVESEELAA